MKLPTSTPLRWWPALAALFFGVACRALPPTATEDRCPVHGVRMERVTLRVIYGMPSSAEFAEMRVAKERFPHGRDFVLGGCVVKPKKTVDGFLCPACVEARKEWLEKNPPKNTGQQPDAAR